MAIKVHVLGFADASIKDATRSTICLNILFHLILSATLARAAGPHSKGPSLDSDVLPRLCETSGMCSLELNPSHYYGPVGSNIELKQALRVLAFKNEIIVMMEFRAASAAQFLSNFQVYIREMAIVASELTQ